MAGSTINGLSPNSGGWKSEIKMSAGLVPSWQSVKTFIPCLSSSFWWQLAIFAINWIAEASFKSLPPPLRGLPPRVFVSVSSSCFIRTSHRGPILFQCDLFLTSYICNNSKQGHILRWEVGWRLQHIFLRNITHNSPQLRNINLHFIYFEFSFSFSLKVGGLSFSQFKDLW